MSFETIGETIVDVDAPREYPAPKVAGVKRHAGIAGQFAMTAEVTYPDEPTRHVEFVGSMYGGPVIGIFANGPQTLIRNPERFGNFGTDPIGWVLRYFA